MSGQVLAKVRTFHPCAKLSTDTAVKIKKSTLQILPCVVSQLLSATDDNNTFTISNCQINQVSLVGIVRKMVPSVTLVKYLIDDMTGPPLYVKQWVDTEEAGFESTLFSPGTYVRVSGSLRSFEGLRSLLALKVRCLVDLDEMTSHMLEVVQAHMQLAEETAGMQQLDKTKSVSVMPTYGLSTIQSQILNVIKNGTGHSGISLCELKAQLGYLSFSVIRQSLNLLLNEGHIYSTIDNEHFKSLDVSG